MTPPRTGAFVPLTIAAVAVAAFGALGLQYRAELRGERATVARRLASLADEQVLLVRNRLEDGRVDLRTCLTASRGRGAGLAPCRDLVRPPAYEWIQRLDGAGRRTAVVSQDGAPPAAPDRALVAAARDSGEALSVVVLRMDAGGVFRALESVRLFSETAESLVAVRRGDRVFFVSPHRDAAAREGYPASAPRLPAARALRGEAFDGAEVDYRGKPVVAVARRIPDTGWVLVTKVDAAEVARPVRARVLSEAALLLGALLAAAFAFARQLRRQEARHEGERRGTEEALREKTRLLDSFLEHSLTPVVLLDRDFRFLRVNEAYAKACGKRIDEFPGRGHFELYPNEDNERIFRDVVRTKTPYRAVAKPFEFADHPEWGTTYWDWLLVPLVGADGEVESVVFSLEDVTERVRAENELRRRSDELADLYDRAPCGYHSLGPDGTFLRINETELAWLGYSRDEIVGKKTFSDLLAPHSLKTFRQEFPAFKERGWVKGLEFDMVRKDGSILPVLVSATAIKDERGRYLMSRSTVFDNSERRRADEAQRHLAAMVEGSEDAIIGETFDGVITSWNDGARRLYGWSAAEAVGESASIVVPEGGRAEFQEIRAKVRRGEHVAHREVDRARKDGATVRVSLSVSPVKGPDGAVVGVSVVARDVSERWKAEQEVARLSRAMKTLSLCNEALVRAKDEQELLDRVCRIIVEAGGYRFAWVAERVDDAAKSVRARAQAGFEEGYLEGLRVTWADEAEGRGPTGTAIRDGTIEVSRDFETDPRMAPWRAEALKRGYRASIALPLSGNGRAFGALMIYATEAGAFGGEEVALLRELSEDLAFGLTGLRVRAARDAAEAALREREADLNRAQAVARIGSWVLDIPKNVLSWSPETHRMFGVAPGTPLTYEIFLDRIHPDDRDAVNAAWMEALARRPYDIEHRLVVDGVLKWVRERAEVEFSPDGAPLRGIGTVQDITEHKKAEAAVFEAQQVFRTLVESSPDIIARYDRDCRRTYVNPTYLKVAGGTAESMLAKTPLQASPLPKEGAELLQNLLRTVLDGGAADPIDVRLTKGGAEAWYNVSAFPEHDREGRIVSVMTVSRDITARKRAEEAVARSARALRTLSRCNEALVRAKAEDELLRSVCRIVVQEGGYCHAWVGFRVEDAARTVRPAARACRDDSCHEEGALEALGITWGEDERGLGPTGAAMRDGVVAVCRDTGSDPAFAPWREDARAHGYRSAVALPLTVNGSPFGALMIYASAPDAFSADELALLKELSQDLAYGVSALRARAARELAEKEREQFHKFFMTSADLMAIADPQGAFLKTNPSFTETLGYSEAELVSKPFVDFIHPDDEQATVDEMARQMKVGYSLNFENRYRCKDGSYKWLSWRAIYSEKEKITYATARDVTAQKQADEALRKKSRSLRTLSLCNEALVRAKEEHELLERICRIVVEQGGYPLAWVGYRVDDEAKTVRVAAWAGDGEEYLAKTLITWADAPRGRGPAGTAIRDAAVAVTRDFETDPAMAPWRAEARKRGYRAAIGLPLSSNGAPFGTLVIYATGVGAFTDDEVALLKELSEDLAFGVASLRTRAARAEAEEALRAASVYNRSLIEASLDPLVTIGPDGRITDVNGATEAATGRSRDELIGTDFSGYFTKPAEARAGYERVFRDSRVRDYPLELRARDGTVTPVLYNATVYRDDAGEVVGVFAAARDMTEIARAQEALRAAGAYNRSLIEASLDPLVTIGSDGRITDVNGATEAATGRSRRELIGTDFSSYFTEPEAARAGYERAFRDGQVRDYPLRLRGKDGSVVPVLYNATVYRDAAGKVVGVFAAARDMTEVERSRAELGALEQKYRLIVENSRDLISLVDTRGVCVYASPSYREILGYAPAELEGRDIFWLLPKERVAEMQGVFAESQKAPGPTVVEVEMLHKSGEARAFEISGLWLRDAAGAPTPGMIGARDVTERKRLQSERQHAQRMESVGVLAGGVAHDFNNILMTILANCSFLLTSLGSNDPRRADVEEIKAAGERAAALTRQLLIFSRKQKTQPVVLDLNASVANLLKMLRRLIGEDIKIETVLSADPVMALIDPGQIEQVVTNLAVNARDAMPEGGRLVLRTEILPAGAPHAPAAAAGDGGRRARLTVEDTGCGMPPAVVAHLFEPFFTTKPVGKGTGLGLSTVYGIVRSAQGDVSVRSAPGAGSAFAVDLPLASAAPASAPASAAPGTAARGGETGLIVEDDETLRRIDARVLTERGYRVLAARDGEEALKLLHDGAKDAALMVTDVVMPGIGGGELARQAVAFKPGLKVMFVSGYVEHGALERLAGTRYEFLQKPFPPEVLASKVREVLDRKDAPPAAGAV
ncbi:MAG: PAS domain S-box protein [Elusimicrobia bacterium]|nr:PAS domain S-box protein [Elusimicrobiota bacterium]